MRGISGSAVMLGLSVAVATAEEPRKIRGSCMGTTYVVSVANSLGSPAVEKLADRVGDELERVEQVFSLYRPTSELSRWNAAASGEWIGVSQDLLAVAKLALELARETDGAFDPTVAPLVRLWRLRQVSADWSPPSSSAIVEARKRVGVQLVELRDEPPAIRKAIPGVELDLNAVVEGWAIDRIVDLLWQSGIHNALVELGGEFRALGYKQQHEPWKIGLENPLETRSLYATASVHDAALATSGDYRQAMEYGGRRYSHILDGRTGRPVEHDLVAVSVVANDAVTADGWATALMALGPIAGFKLAEQKGLAVSFVVREGSKIRVRLSTAAVGCIVLKQ